MNRRSFIKTASLFAAFAGTALHQVTAHANKGLVKLTDATAKALKYVHDATKADKKLRIKRGATEGAKQFCYNCNFYQGKKDSKQAKCILIQSGEVAGKGWCNSWALKPGS